MTTTRQLTVLVVDDHPVFAEALALAIDADDLMTCVGTAPDLDRALVLVEEAEPDVVIMDVDLGTADGLVGTREIRARHPETHVLILTGQPPAPSLVLAAVEAGASGLLPKGARLGAVVAAVTALRDGTFAVDRQVLAAALLATTPAGPERGRGSLTAREQQILELLAEGVDVQAAARRLGLSAHTCRGHVKNVLVKLGAHSQLEAIAKARAAGLLDSDG